MTQEVAEEIGFEIVTRDVRKMTFMGKLCDLSRPIGRPYRLGESPLRCSIYS